MAEARPSTTAPELVSFEDAAALDFDPIPINRAVVEISGDELNNPHMVNVRLAAVTLAKTKAELIELVREAGALSEDGGELAILVGGMHRTEELFSAFVEALRSADARLFSATCAATLADEAA